jgi:hypothetical protein
MRQRVASVLVFATVVAASLVAATSLSQKRLMANVGSSTD